MFSRPELGSDPPNGSGQESGCDTNDYGGFLEASYSR